jgi:hypothetical protein
MSEMLDDIEELPDGSAIISLEEFQEEPQQFDDNMAEQLPESLLSMIADELLEKIDTDKKARTRRDELYEEGIRRTGLGSDAPGGAQFAGASRVVHPVMAESCVDFAARAIKELFPASGPVKIETEGLIDPNQELQIKQVALCLNNQFTHEIVEYRDVYEQMLTQLPLGGSQYIKFSVNASEERINAEFVPIDDIFIPYDAPNFYSAHRRTHRQYITHDTYRDRVESGEYRDLDFIISTLEPEQSATTLANDKVEGRTRVGNEDGTRTIYEVYTRLSFATDELSKGKKSPYIITIDEVEQKILSVRRNWDSPDRLRKELHWIVEDTFIPWRGAQGIGLPQLIGGLSGAATGALRALLDSAHINNAPTALKLKGSRINGASQSVAVTQVADIEGPAGIDDIRKYIMPMPFNAPSPVLMQLLGWLTDASKGVVSTASEKIADATSNTPVGTVQALIEQGAVIFSSIHARLHFSQAKKFEIVLWILKNYFPQKLQEYGINPQVVSMRGVHPVSDPRVFSEAQRFAQAQSMLQMAEKAGEDPTIRYNKYELHRSILSLMKVQNLERILPPPPQPPQPTDPAGELIAFVQNQPVAVVPQQDHASHIVVHLGYLKDQMMSMNPVMVPVTIKVLDHLREHLALFFAQRLMMSAQQGQQMAMQQGQQVRPEQVMTSSIDQILQQDEQLANEALENIVKVDAFVREHMMAQNPESALIKVQADYQNKSLQLQAEKQQNDLRVKLLQEEIRAARSDFDHSLSIRTQEHKEYIAQLQAQQQSSADNMAQRVEILKNEMDNNQKQLTELLKNHDDNRTSVLIEQMKASLTQVKPQEEPKEDKEYVRSIEGLIEKANSAQMSGQLGLIMEGLKETIASARAPRKTVALKDENGEMIGARSEIDEG